MSDQLHHYQDAIADSYGPYLDQLELQQLRDEACAAVDRLLVPMDPTRARLLAMRREILEGPILLPTGW